MFELINTTNVMIEELEKVNELISYAVKREKLENAIFNVIIVDNNKIHELNKEYRGIDRVTDVISFALEDFHDIDLEIRMLGDIYISYEKAKEQADYYGHSYLRELSFLTIHGLLHLLGYDHMKKEDEEIMFKKQEVILNEFGISK
ncbi:MAG: rRNA maturation RNase YbeY [Candidatus Faecisoma sp.]|jgi:probable rRNA maturation factor|nr:rRNA maturation RNase YbeY [Acholeplasma sp.]MDY2892359.1 rRNA maturation RNase YbeY [Candidatus Faecisoma sp.]CCY27511.1 probable rRNA maturation factor [Acholeplasma sp. CAG:878]